MFQYDVKKLEEELLQTKMGQKVWNQKFSDMYLPPINGNVTNFILMLNKNEFVSQFDNVYAVCKFSFCACFNYESFIKVFSKVFLLSCVFLRLLLHLFEVF